MKLIRLLALTLFIASCSDRAEVERQEPKAEPARPAAAEAEKARTPPAPPAAPARKTEPIEDKEARAAADGPVRQEAGRTGVNADAAVLQDFKARVDQYLKIHKNAAKGPARLKESNNPAEITNAQDTLSARIRAARAGAKHGDIFTAEISTAFRRLLAPEMKGEDGRDTKAVMKTDAPPTTSVAFKVNAKYPEGQPLPTTPANVLLKLPRLPEPLQYRIIGRHLVLLDSAADLVVDYIPNAIK
jgi:hypothetical protein